MTTQIEWPEDRVKELLNQVELTSGHHSNGQKASAMDVIGMAVEGEWTDTPKCVHPLLAGRAHRINDHPMTDADDRRRIVLEAGPLLIGTAENTARAVIISHRSGLTVDGLVDALKTTPEVGSLYRANLARTDLSKANLYGTNLAGTNLAEADLYGANLSGADLYGANLSGAVLYGAVLYGANLSGAVLAGADLSGAVLYGTNLAGTNLAGADLYGANLSGAVLAGADLARANLARTDLSKANLYGTNLAGTNLAEADLYGANLARAKHDGATIWPKGFDFEAATR